VNERVRWGLGIAALAAAAGALAWLVITGAPIVRFTERLYSDNVFLKETVAAWGWAAPLVFVAIQALQVIISPIPGEITGPVGGALFGTLWGVVYSTIGLTAGTLFCFWLGRVYGEPLVRPWLSEHHWQRVSFILEAEGAIFCFIIYLIPGFPKDIVSDPLLGVRRRVDAGPAARHLGVVLRRRPRRRPPVHLRVRAPGARRRGEPAALLLSPRDHRLLPPTGRATRRDLTENDPDP